MVILPLWIDTARDQADFGLAKTSRPWPVSSRDFRLARTTGHPFLIPFAIPLPAMSSSWETVSRTMSSYSSISNVTRLWAEGSEACDGFAQVMTRRVGGETSITLPTSWTVRSSLARTCSHFDPGFQSETFSWPQ